MPPYSSEPAHHRSCLNSSRPRRDMSLDITRALQVSIRGLPKDWRRPPGRPRHTWLRTLEADLQPHNLGLNSACTYAQDREHWNHLMETATLQLGHAREWRDDDDVQQSASTLQKYTWQNVSNKKCSHLMFKLSFLCNHTSSKSLFATLQRLYRSSADQPIKIFPYPIRPQCVLVAHGCPWFWSCPPVLVAYRAQIL